MENPSQIFFHLFLLAMPVTSAFEKSIFITEENSSRRCSDNSSLRAVFHSSTLFPASRRLASHAVRCSVFAPLLIPKSTKQNKKKKRKLRASFLPIFSHFHKSCASAGDRGWFGDSRSCETIGSGRF